MEGYTSLRNRLIPGLMEVLASNKHHPHPQNIYEVDDVVLLDPSTETGARSERRLAVALCHARANFSEAKAVLNSILENLDVEVEVEEGKVKVTYTLTTPGCPLGPVIDGQIKDSLMELAGVKEVISKLTFTPPWDPRKMAGDDVKMQLGIW